MSYLYKHKQKETRMTFQQARDAGYSTHRYHNGDWEYLDEKGDCHLYRDGIELTQGVIAIYCQSYDNFDWEYHDEDGRRHFMPKEQA